MGDPGTQQPGLLDPEHVTDMSENNKESPSALLLLLVPVHRHMALPVFTEQNRDQRSTLPYCLTKSGMKVKRFSVLIHVSLLCCMAGSCWNHRIKRVDAHQVKISRKAIWNGLNLMPNAFSRRSLFMEMSCRHFQVANIQIIKQTRRALHAMRKIGKAHGRGSR